MNEWMNEWKIHEWMINEWMNESTNPLTNQRINDWVSEWMELISADWLKEQINKWMNQWLTDWRTDRPTEGMIEWMSEWMNEWVPRHHCHRRWLHSSCFYLHPQHTIIPIAVSTYRAGKNLGFTQKIKFLGFLKVLTYTCRTENYDPQAQIWPGESYKLQFISEYHLY